MPPTLLKKLGISSPQEAAEIELDLGIRFNDFTPQHCDTWREQTLYLYQYARTLTFTHAARAAGVSIRKARQWQSENTLGFNQRLELAVLEYTEDIDVLLLERARQPDSPPTFLSMLLRAQMPEKYGPARHRTAPRDNHCDCDHDRGTEPKPPTQPDASNLSPTDLSPVGADSKPAHDLSPTNRPSVGAGFKPALVPSPTTEETQRGDSSPTPNDASDLAPTDHSPVGAGFKPALVPSPTTEETQREDTPQHPAPSTQNPAPSLTRRKRRELQRKHKRKRQKSHRPRAPN